MRFGLNKDLGFSEKDRNENIRRIAEVSALLGRMAEGRGVSTQYAALSKTIGIRDVEKKQCADDVWL